MSRRYPKINSERWLDAKSFSHEEWRTLDFLPCEYAVSNVGRVRKRLPRGGFKILYSVDNGRKYFAVSIKHKKYYVHRLVGAAFVPNPNGYNEIDHINSDREDNRAVNIRWCTHLMNMHNEHYVKSHRERIVRPRRPVKGYDKDGNEVASWESIVATARALDTTIITVHKYIAERKPLCGYYLKIEDIIRKTDCPEVSPRSPL